MSAVGDILQCAIGVIGCGLLMLLAMYLAALKEAE
jgi:hypothetical protein